MISQIRYPRRVAQDESEGKEWDDLDNIKLDNWEELAKCTLKPHQKPARIFCSDFNFNIPDKAVVTQIIVEHDFSKENSSNVIVVNPPMMKMESVEKSSYLIAGIHPANRIVTFDRGDFELRGKDINNDDFCVEIAFPENISENEGDLYLDFIRIKLIYDYPQYVLSSGEFIDNFPTANNPLKKHVGDILKYNATFRNSNGIITDKQEVKVSIPDGLEIEKIEFESDKIDTLEGDAAKIFKDKFDEENMIWYPSVRGKNFSTLKLSLRCIREGTYSINSFNKYAGYSGDFCVEVFPEGCEIGVNKFEMEDTEQASDEESDIDERETAIKIDNVSMEFELPQEKIDNLKEYFIKWAKREIKPKNYFKALDNVSFEIKKGERVGVIGFNGAGKSTLLKVVAGVYTPTKGTAHINGKVAPLLELGAGFDYNYSGRENVFLNGSILGYSRKFLESKYDEILEFSELGEFMEIPIKNYSSGMKAKLGFSIATIINPEILILDEVLSVGDVKFQKKSGDKIKSMMDDGTTVLLVSHSTAKIRELCTRAIWLDNGKLVLDGDVDFVCDAYLEAAKRASDDEVKNLEIV